MRQIIFKVASVGAKIGEYIAYGGTFLMLLGAILTFAFRYRISEMNLSQTYGMSLPLVIYASIGGAVISFFVARLLKNAGKIIENLSEEAYFAEENVKYSKRIVILLFALTAVEIGSKVIFSLVSVGRVSAMYDMSVRDYAVNIIFMVIACSLTIVFDRGRILKEDSESII
ncbi:MAG: hypothetical protein SPI65_04705 [Peptoniphilus sp.]|nr:hypothetical protein [Peptoniphilus sp.]MDD7362893.1 hypothetical protein [Bacillota bacterium]MDY6044866.1 hypothetical protein [Peptoniphilus sp.]